MAHFYSGPLRSVLLVSVLLGNLAVVPDLFATPPQPPDASRRLYDRVMEEFRHKDYNAALAGFRFSSNCTVNRPSQRMPSIGWVSATTAWGISRMPWDRFTTSFPIIH